MPLSEELDAKIRALPRKPGVYIMRDHEGRIIYIGKATELRTRVRSYFTGHDTRNFVQHLDDLLGDLEIIITFNPKEAQILENTLIKKHKPRFNIMLRDDKTYLSLRINTAHQWPRLDVVRRPAKDGSLYFGPYHSSSSAREMLQLVNRHFQLRTCRDTVLYNRARPCLQYQIKRCPGPCVFPISRDDYMADVKAAAMFLGGRNDDLIGILEERMMAAAERYEYESAAQIRDQLEAVRTSLTKQRAVVSNLVDRDVIGVYREGDSVAISVLHIRGGAMQDLRGYTFENQIFPTASLLEDFIAQLYALDSAEPPAEVVVPEDIDAEEELQELLSERRGTRCLIITPKRGDRVALLELAAENARQLFAERLTSRERSASLLARLKDKLHLDVYPRRMECFDISNFQGTQVVASQVVFEDGIAKKSDYKRYRIKTVDGQDDFASMFEVLRRRAKRAKDGTDPMPDLIVIDGGKGQLGMAVAALSDLGLKDQAIVSLAKSRITGLEPASDSTTRSPERVFRPGQKNAIILRANSDECLLLERIRDEAHRFAITFHRELRNRETIFSAVDGISGVGKERGRLLLRHFGSARKVKQATLRELEAVPGLPRGVAAAVFGTFHTDAVDPAPADD